jgi:hypothetical protein
MGEQVGQVRRRCPLNRLLRFGYVSPSGEFQVRKKGRSHDIASVDYALSASCPPGHYLHPPAPVRGLVIEFMAVVMELGRREVACAQAA